MSSNQSDNSQGDTGTHDIVYNLVSTIYHTLQGAETEAIYIADAEQEGDQELVQFFRSIKEENQRRADQAKQLLGRYLARQQGGGQGQAASGGGNS
jgi:hypothetical protein